MWKRIVIPNRDFIPKRNANKYRSTFSYIIVNWATS